MDLPIAQCLDDVVQSLGRSIPVVLKAPTGAGKTTGVPHALLDRGVLDSGQLLLAQPRRLAARAAASRLAQLDRSALGDRIGYQVRFDSRTTPRTRLIVVTTGVLLRLPSGCLGCCLLFQLSYSFFHLLAGLERDDEFLGYRDGRARPQARATSSG